MANKSRAPQSHSSDEHRRVVAQFKNAYQWLAPVQILYLVNSVEGFGLTAYMIWSMNHWIVDLQLGLLTILIGATVVALGIVGALFVPHFPFTCSVILAAFNSVSFTFSVMLDDSWVSSGFILLSAIALWLAVIPMVRISRLVREHPDEMWAHRIAGTERKRLELKGGVRAAKERQVELLTAARRRAVYFSIGATLAVFAATGAATYKRFTYLHSTPFEPVARELESLWKASQTERIANLLDRGVVGNERENFLAQLRSRKWDQRLPAFTSSTVHSDDTAYRQTLFLEAGQVDLRWRWSDGAWRIRAYALPAPTARSFAERFRKVWNASDVDGVANLFRPDAVSKARRYLTRLVERREWKSGFPPLDAFQELSKGGSSAEIHFDVGEGTLIVSCEYNSNGEWYIVGLKFPND